jgi:hypothetical protein
VNTIKRLAEAVRYGDVGLLRHLQDTWGYSGLEVVAKLAAESGLITMGEYHNAVISLDQNEGVNQ